MLREIAQWLGAHTALPEDWSSASSTHIRMLMTAWNSSLEGSHSLLDPLIMCSHMHINTCADMSINNVNESNLKNQEEKFAFPTIQQFSVLLRL